VEAQGFCICLLKINAGLANLKSYGPKTFLFQKEGNFTSLYRSFQKSTGEVLEACSCISFFLVFPCSEDSGVFFPLRFFLPGYVLQMT